MEDDIIVTTQFSEEDTTHLKISLFQDNDTHCSLQRPYTFDSLRDARRLLTTFPSFPSASNPSSTRMLEDHGHDDSPEPIVERGPPLSWLCISNADTPAMEEVLSWLPLHDLTVRAVTGAPRTEDKVEYFPSYNYAFLTLIAPSPRTSLFSSEDRTVTLYLIVFPSFLLCITGGYFAAEDEIGLAVLDITRGGAMNVGIVVAAYFSTILSNTQKVIRQRLVEANDLDELVLQVMPSDIDVQDLHERMRQVRHRVSDLHLHLLMKQRILQILLLPVLQESTVCPNERVRKLYQALLNEHYKIADRVSRGKDTVNMSSLSLMCGVCARLVEHCHHMDYLNHVQSQISLIVMPINVIPGVFAMNVAVPWMSAESFKPFIGITVITIALFIIGMIVPFMNFFRYKSPGALAPL
ncbi:hypothetical protein AGDE_11020 [Angomonas deanei]|uniref:CorA-like Mg2+ transporter protein, putative n=1 Tax=Angomonas deanei TaxID=59799 RepID=A0A7G2CKT5_9TRYP|nr:hypothetical protein AGDE_11020 [Angomonas deanei]CAD2218822.1 CorA-like Mg2+ transporter protein, putative [Angomonas deanei]|eukprot:EPY26931.1 hypothetical protein AGDE_11020 [Angomonas deanei]